MCGTWGTANEERPGTQPKVAKLIQVSQLGDYNLGLAEGAVRFWVGVTDWDWYSLHASAASVEEVNFWRPSPTAGFSALHPGELFLFKLHAPRNFIAGGAFFTKFTSLPVSLAWEAFGLGNGARTLEEVRRRISKYRDTPIAPGEDPTIGCILLEEPFFWPVEDWIDSSPYFSLNIVSGKTYDASFEVGQHLWNEVQERLIHTRGSVLNPGPAPTAVTANRFGLPQLVFPRLGQGSFRILVTDAYQRRCAMTGEKTLPVLEAAHIRPYASDGHHEISNGVLLRSDLHTLFDRGYLGIDPDDLKVMVSPSIKEQFSNGRNYYALHGMPVALPVDSGLIPSRENLVYHAENIFR